MSDFPKHARAATEAIRGLFPETPLQRNDHLSARYGAEIWLKREDLTPVRSYKLRGAFNAMRKVRARTPDQQHFVCASAGNHAQGVAYACRHFGVRGTIFMPVTTPQQKIDKTRVFGGDNIRIELTGDYFDQTLAAAQAWCAEAQAHFLSPFDDPDVMPTALAKEAAGAFSVHGTFGGWPLKNAADDCSYWAASSKKTNTTARPKAMTPVLPAVFWAWASSVHS